MDRLSTSLSWRALSLLGTRVLLTLHVPACIILRAHVLAEGERLHQLLRADLRLDLLQLGDLIGKLAVGQV